MSIWHCIFFVVLPTHLTYFNLAHLTPPTLLGSCVSIAFLVQKIKDSFFLKDILLKANFRNDFCNMKFNMLLYLGCIRLYV